MLDQLRPLILSLFAVDSIGSVILRGLIWLGIALIIIVSTDSVNTDMSRRKLKSNLGFFLMFILISGGLIYWLFGFNLTPHA